MKFPTRRVIGQLASGEPVDAWTLCGAGGLEVEALTLGGILRRIVLPDGTDVALGFSELAPYLGKHPFFGAITGRVAGRIAGARFAIDGEVYELATNEPPNHLHGGLCGFDKQMWTATPRMKEDGSPCIDLRHTSADGHEGYPGEVDFTMSYSVRADNALLLESRATTTKPTPLSVMNHTYFNLAGEGNGNILDHELQVIADEFVPMGEGFLPQDRLEPVRRAEDLRMGKVLRHAVPEFAAQHGPLYATGATAGNAKLVARLRHRPSGRTMECWTDAPYLQIYTGAYLPPHHIGKAGQAYQKFSGICVECEGYSNGANAPQMGSTVLMPGEVQRTTTIYKFVDAR